MVIFVVLVTVGVTVKTSVANESQPVELNNESVWVPALVNVKLFQVYGSWSSHMVMFVVLVTVGVTVKTSVANESHPVELVKVSTCVPALVNVKLFQVYGS